MHIAAHWVKAQAAVLSWELYHARRQTLIPAQDRAEAEGSSGANRALRFTIERRRRIAAAAANRGNHPKADAERTRNVPKSLQHEAQAQSEKQQAERLLGGHHGKGAKA